MLRHAHRVLAAATLALIVAFPAAGPASAALPGANGRITFMRFEDDGFGQIWVANPDMSHQVELTSGRNDGWFPTWSPDGTRIAFGSSRADPDLNDDVAISDIYTMRPDGSDVRKLTDSVGDSEKPSWSPDGRWLVYSADRGNYPDAMGLYLIRSDGSGTPHRLTSLPDGAFWQELARFSPDGSRIVFDEYRGGHILTNHRDGSVVGEQAALFTIRPDGTGKRQLIPWGLHGTDADWSPDGKHLVFAGQPTHAGNIGDVMVADADGSHVTDLSEDHGLTGLGQNPDAFQYSESFNPAWSPDGTTIVFVHAEFTTQTDFHFGFQLMNPDGSNRRWLSQDFEHQPDWGSVPPVP
jgi:Tol biopolymer transport system component